PRTLKPEIPKDLETVCLKAMAKQPRNRYPNCQEFAEDLRRWHEGEPIRARNLGFVERTVRWCRKEPVLALMGGAVVASVVLVAAVTTLSAKQLGAFAQREREAREVADRNAEAAQVQAERAQEEAENARGARFQAEQRELKALRYLSIANMHLASQA